MDEELVHRLESSFEAIKPKSELLVETFYTKLFNDHPEVRPMFPEQMKEQRKKLHQALAFVIANLRNPDKMKEQLLKLGAGHVAFGTKAEHYPMIRDDMLYSMAVVAGDLWTDELQEDWTGALNTVAKVMLEGAASVEGKDSGAMPSHT